MGFRANANLICLAEMKLTSRSLYERFNLSLLRPTGDEQEEMKGEEEDEANDCLRDSGCFIPAECSDS